MPGKVEGRFELRSHSGGADCDHASALAEAFWIISIEGNVRRGNRGEIEGGRGKTIGKDAGCVIIVRGMEIKVLGTSMVKGARGENPSGMDGEGGQDRRGVPQEGRIQFVVH